MTKNLKDYYLSARRTLDAAEAVEQARAALESAEEAFAECRKDTAACITACGEGAPLELLYRGRVLSVDPGFMEYDEKERHYVITVKHPPAGLTDLSSELAKLNTNERKSK